MTNKELPEITQCKNILADLHEELDKIKKWAGEAGYRRIPLWYDCQHLFDMISFYENRLKKLQRLHTKNTFAIYDHVMHKAGDVWAYDFIIKRFGMYEDGIHAFGKDDECVHICDLKLYPKKTTIMAQQEIIF